MKEGKARRYMGQTGTPPFSCALASKVSGWHFAFGNQPCLTFSQLSNSQQYWTLKCRCRKFCGASRSWVKYLKQKQEKKCISRSYQKAASNGIPGWLNFRSQVSHTVLAKQIQTLGIQNQFDLFSSNDPLNINILLLPEVAGNTEIDGLPPLKSGSRPSWCIFG